MTQPNTPNPVRYCAALLGVTMAGFVMIKTGRDAAFFSRGDSVSTLPSLLLWIGIFALPVAMTHLRLMQVWGTRRTRLVVFGLASVVFGISAPVFNAGWRGALLAMFPVVPVAFAALFASAWLLTADLLDNLPPRARAQGYGKIAAASTLGGIVGAAFSRLASPALDTTGLIRAGAVVLLLSTLVAYRAHRVFPAQTGPRVRTSAPPQSLLAAAPKLLRSSRTGLMAFMSAGAAATGLLVEFQFYASAAQSGATDPKFFATFYFWLGLVTLLVQLFVAPALQRAIGSRTLVLLPLGVLGGISLVLASLGLWTRWGLRLVESTLKSAVHRASWEQAYLPINREIRGPTKALVDGAIARMSEAVVAGALIIYISSLDGGQVHLMGLTLVTAAMGTVWLFAAWKFVATDEQVPVTTISEGSAPPDAACQATAALGATLPELAHEERGQ